MELENTDSARAAKVMGQPYLDVMARIHARRAPSTYLEIGTQTGASLRLAKCASIAIDPAFIMRGEVIGGKPSCLLFQSTSDAFFEAHDPVALLGRPIDMAFLDGMHLAEFLLRDFINTERCCTADSVIVMHDCLPPNFEVASRNFAARPRSGPFAQWWAGDVWRVVPTLRRHRPDLKISILDAPPTGLVVVENLDPTSTLLREATLHDGSRQAFEDYWSEIAPQIGAAAGFMA